jgi:cardiolipin synthase
VSLAAVGPVSVVVAGHHLTVFVESPPLFDAMLGDIAAATGRVWVETYIFLNDAGGTRFAEALKDAARRGLDVRLLVDAVGCNTTPDAFFKDIADAGVRVHIYHTLLEGIRQRRPLSFFNSRNHRKIMVVDDTAAYFGGMNIIDNVPSVKEANERNLPASAGWRDVHLRIAGPRVPEIAVSFERSWLSAHGEHQPRRIRAFRRNLRQCEFASEEIIRFFDSGPAKPFSRAARIYSTFIKSAQRSITLSMAYFLPVGATLRELLRARRKRRVTVRVVVPGASDVRLVQHATAFLYDRLLRRGFRIYERLNRMLHSKVMVVDDLYTIVGSANLDPRSFYANLEFIAVIRSRALAQVMNAVCHDEIAQSQRISLDWCRSLS